MSAQTVVAALGWVLLNFLWQGCVVACITAELLVALRNARPEARYAVACLGLALCLAWPAAVLFSILAGPHDAQAGGAFLGIGLAGTPALEAGNWLAWLQAHTGWIVALWAACVGSLCLRMAMGLLWIDRTVRTEHGDPAWQARLSAMAQRCGLGRAVRLRIVAKLASPVTAGWWRPIVLVPASLVSGMPPHLLEALLAHELGHIKRHDYLVNLLQNVVEILLLYHPAVWWISRRIRAEREQIADDFAARHLVEPHQLAQALSELERLQFADAGLAQAANGGDLLARIRRLLRPSKQALDWRAAVPILGLALAFAGSAQALVGRDAVLGGDRGMPGRSTGALVDFGSCAKPDYPHADLEAGHQGAVTLSFLVGQDGKVGDSKVVKSSGFATMDEAARTAIAKCRFHPALDRGRAVDDWTKVMYVWTLE
jgi:bla regulator protein blaR1